MMSSVQEKLDLWFAKNEKEVIRLKVSSLWSDTDDPFVDLLVKVLKCGDEEEAEFRAHKLVLGMSSSVLASLLYGERGLNHQGGGDATTTTELEIKQLHPSIVKMMLEFIYTDSVALPEELELERIGGLLYAAKRYNIRKLISFCDELLGKDLTYRKALEQFDQLLDSKSNKNNRIKVLEYEKELMKHFFAYILRNGEGVLRSEHFKHISAASLQWICRADYLCASELTVYRAIFRWAKDRCRKQNLDMSMENCRRLLRINDNSLGIMKLVRFPQLDFIDFIKRVDRNDESNRLLPANLVNELNKFFVLEEPTNLCCSTPRCDNYEDETTFKQYVDDFVNKKAFKTLSKLMASEAGAATRSSCNQGLSKENDINNSKGKARLEDLETRTVPNCNVENTPTTSNPVSGKPTSGNSCDTGISTVQSNLLVSEDDQEKQLNQQAIDSGEALPCETSSGFATPDENLENFQTDVLLPDSPDNANCDSYYRRRLFVTPQKEDFICPSFPAKASEAPKTFEKSDDEIEQPTTSVISSPIYFTNPETILIGSVNNKTASRAEVAECIAGCSSPLIRYSASQPTYKITTTPVVEPKKTAATQLPVPPKKTRKRGYGDDKRSPSRAKKTLKIQSQQNNKILGVKKPSNVDPNRYDSRSRVVSYQDIIKECSKDSRITAYTLNDSVISDFKKRSTSFQSVHMPDLVNYCVEFKANPLVNKATLVKDLNEINLEHYIFFYHGNANSDVRLNELWSRPVNVKLSFSGILVFELNASSGTLVINYTKNSSFFRLNQLDTETLKSLNLANSTLLPKNWLNPNCSKYLLELRLFCVRTLRCQKILKQCENLQHLSVWPAIGGACLSLDDINASELLSLSASNLMIKFNTNDMKEFNLLERIFLQDCTWDEEFVEKFPKLFPNLRQISISSRYCPPGPDWLKLLIKMKSVRRITFWNFDCKSLEKMEFRDLKLFLRKLDIKKSAAGCHFKLKREIGGEWEGCNNDFEKLCGQVYNSFGYRKFYTIEMWKHVWSTYLSCV